MTKEKFQSHVILGMKFVVFGIRGLVDHLLQMQILLSRKYRSKLVKTINYTIWSIYDITILRIYVCINNHVIRPGRQNVRLCMKNFGMTHIQYATYYFDNSNRFFIVFVGYIKHVSLDCNLRKAVRFYNKRMTVCRHTLLINQQFR